VVSYSLSVTSSHGLVTSSPPGITCGSTCTASYSSGTVVTLTASASSGFVFTGWSGGGCGGTGTCVITLTGNTSVTAAYASSSNPVFTALHTYYIAPTGNDSTGNGTSGNPWLTPNHTAVCGDAFLAATGTYPALTVSTQPTACPSTSGGIDGTGGVYGAIVLCQGNAQTCVWSGSGSSGAVVDFTASNWIWVNVTATSTNIGAGSGMRGFQCDATASGTTILHHIALINAISYHNQQGFTVNDGALNHNVPGNGCDYFAVVGSMAQNAANDPICLAAIDLVGPANFDANAGTHFFIDGNFALANNTTSTCSSDMQAISVDTPDAHGLTGQIVISNNMTWKSTRYGLSLIYQEFNLSALPIKIYNNTFFGDLANVTNSDFADGEINLGFVASGSAGLPTWNITIQNNIAQTIAATSNGNTIYAMTVGGTTWGTNGTLTNGGSGTQNWLHGLASSCGGTCDSTKSEVTFASNPLGTNSFGDALFANTTDLLANWVGAPSCTSFATVTACMGYNVATATLTSATPIADLVPSASGTSGKGYQLQSTTCAPNADYPAWLKGVVRLQWNAGSSTITEQADLISKPCGM
jgi:hypothetical protein